MGTLTCSLSASIGLVVGSQRNVSCLFRGTSGEPDEPYTGTMTRVGLDVGLTTGSVIFGRCSRTRTATKGCSPAPIPGRRQKCPLPLVSAPTSSSAGSNRTLALQPLSVQGQIGLDIAAGVGSLDLHPSW